MVWGDCVEGVEMIQKRKAFFFNTNKCVCKKYMVRLVRTCACAKMNSETKLSVFRKQVIKASASRSLVRLQKTL